MPDLMAAMLQQKIAHPKAGANTAWVPSPTAATLHALHYHQVDVFAVQKELEKTDADRRAPTTLLEGLLTIPVVKKAELERRREAAGTRQQRPGHPRLRGALGRPGRGLLQGARHPQRRPDGRPRHAAHQQPAHRQLAAARRGDEGAGERHLPAHGHGGGPAERRRPAVPADGRPLGDISRAFQAACDLVFKGMEQPSGYTEPLLHAARLEVKSVTSQATASAA